MSHLTVIFLVLLLSGCFRGVNKADLPGTYAFEENGLKQEITINANGRYSNTLFSNGAVIWSDAGGWVYETVAGETGITFGDFRSGVDDTSVKFGLDKTFNLPGYWFVVPERTFFGHKQICFDKDANKCFQAREN